MAMRLRIARRWMGLCFAASAGFAAFAQPIDFTDVVVFGDSLSDVGNVANNPIVVEIGSLFEELDPLVDGRFSNGPVWAERLSDKLGLPGSASSYSDAGGDNYAHGAAQTGPDTLLFGIVDNIGLQVSDYTASNDPTGNELFILWGGGNDLLDDDNPQTPGAIRDNMSSHVTALANDGAQRFLVLNLPKLGDIPRNIGTAEQATFNADTSTYNALLATEMGSLASSLSVKITVFDAESLFDRMLDEPASFGFTNTTDSAFLAGASNPDGYVFWDETHPTAAAHAILADAAFIALLDPGDFTGDGETDQADLDQLIAKLGQTTSPFDVDGGDWDGDGLAGGFELSLILDNWTGTAPPDLSAIPEPATGGVLAGLLALTLARRRRSSI